MINCKDGILIGILSSKKIAHFRGALLDWYANYGRIFPWREKTASIYEVIIAEVLLQRTRAETIAGFYQDFIKKYPSWEVLANACENELANFLRPIGLWRRRSVSLVALAQEMVRKNGIFPRQRENIEALPGIGQYIANAVFLFYYCIPQPLLDVNMARVLERVFGPRQLVDIRYDPYLQKLSLEVVKCKKPREVNWALLDLAATICRSNSSLCIECPVRGICLYYSELDKCN
jgi:A/G-specific adenine glycosylase